MRSCPQGPSPGVGNPTARVHTAHYKTRPLQRLANASETFGSTVTGVAQRAVWATVWATLVTQTLSAIVAQSDRWPDKSDQTLSGPLALTE